MKVTQLLRGPRLWPCAAFKRKQWTFPRLRGRVRCSSWCLGSWSGLINAGQTHSLLVFIVSPTDALQTHRSLIWPDFASSSVCVCVCVALQQLWVFYSNVRYLVSYITTTGLSVAFVFEASAA